MPGKFRSVIRSIPAKRVDPNMKIFVQSRMHSTKLTMKYYLNSNRILKLGENISGLNTRSDLLNILVVRFENLSKY